jgi:hypothetical protein
MHFFRAVLLREKHAVSETDEASEYVSETDNTSEYDSSTLYHRLPNIGELSS